LGKTYQVDEILCSSDLFILPSEKESFGLAALEAMALKVPVISTNIGGLSDLVVNGESGYTFNIGDIDAMASKSIEILSDEVKLNKLKIQAYDNAKKYDIQRIIPVYEDLYSRALK